MDQNLGAFEVAQKAVPESMAVMSSLDQARDIREDEASIIAQHDDTQVRGERRKRVVGHLRFRGRQSGDKRGLANVRKAD